MASISTSCFDVVAQADTDSPDMAGHRGTYSHDMPGHRAADSPEMPCHGDAESPHKAGHRGRDSTCVIVHPSTDAKNIFHDNTNVIDYEKIASTIAIDHAYTELANVARHAHTFPTDVIHHTHTSPAGIIHESTDAEDVYLENTEAGVNESTSHTEVDVNESTSHTEMDVIESTSHTKMDVIESTSHIEMDVIESKSHTEVDVIESTSHTEAVEHSHTGLKGMSSTDMVDCASTDTLDEADSVIAYSTNEVCSAETYSTNEIHRTDTYSTNVDDQADTHVANVPANADTESRDAASHGDADSIDDVAVHVSSPMVDSVVKKAHLSRGSSLSGNRRMSTPVTTKEAVSSAPDITPSRRSSRKKQSTFSSDFEYYALGSMKIEMKSEPMFSYKPRQTTSEAQDDDDDEESENDDDNDNDKMKKSAKKKIAEKKHKGRVSEAGDSEEDGTEEEAQSEKGKVKVAVKKKAAKFSVIKSTKKKTIKMEEEESEVGEDSDDDRDGNQDTPKLLKGHKRKKDGGVIKVESKKMKVETDQEDESSDEEDSTPISLLKAKLKEESTPISQLKDKLKEELIPISKLKAELKEESLPISQLKAKLKDSSPATQHQTHSIKVSQSASPHKVKSVEDLDAFSQLQAQIRLKREMEKKTTTSSSQIRSLMERLADGSLDLSADCERSRIHSEKRKLMSGDDTDEVPAKISKSIQIDKLAPALANLVKRLPPPGQGQIKLKSSPDVVGSEAAVSNSAGFTKTHTSFPGKSAAGSSHKHKVKTEGNTLNKSVSVTQKINSDKSGVSKRDLVKEDRPKHLKERKPHGNDVKLVPKKEVRYITKVKVIRKPDGTIIKKKVLVPEQEMKKQKESKLQIKSPERSEEKKPTKVENMKTTDSHQKSSVTTGHTSSMKHNGKLDGDDLKKKKRHEFSNKDGTGLKHKQGLQTKVEHDRKHDRPSLSVDDLLKRGVFPKKKHHQPFGNKNLPKPAVKDLKSDTVKDSTKTDQADKESSVPKIGDKLDLKKWKGKKSSDVRKHSHDRRRSSDSSRRKKSTDADRKRREKPSESDEGQDDGPPVLTPASSVSKPKHKHKVEHEVALDITMNDLFKPDNHGQDQLDKDEVDNTDMSQCSADTHDVQSCVKPEHVYNIMIDHQYSKPASPVMPGLEGQMVDGMITGRDDDIESISHAQAVIMDMNLPDQFLEESDEPVGNDTDNFQDTWPDTMDELQHLVDKRDTTDRPSILESLGSELKESGTEFLIVGQVEVGRLSGLLREERQSTQMHGMANSDHGAEPEKASDGSSAVEKAGVDIRKQSLEKSRDSTDKKSSLPDNERRPSTKDKKSSSEDRKSSLYERKSNSDKKGIESYKKSGSDNKKKYSSEDKKRYSSDDRRKSSSDDKKKTSSDHRRSSTSDKKVSHEDKRKAADTRNDSVEDRKHKDNKKSASAEPRPQDVDDVDDDSGEEQKFQDDENDIDWEPNDTDTLYCICRKPHSNRFMICCDLCEEWFHGSCVGVSRARGKEMEENEEEYICPFCSKGDHDLSLEKPSQSSSSSSSPGQVKSKLLQKCVGRKCSKAPRAGSVYCSNECVMSHAQEALKAIREEQVKKKTSEKQPSTHNSSKSSSSPTIKAPPPPPPPPPPRPSPAADTVEVIERETGKLLTGASAPTQKGLHRWLEQHPTFEVVLPDKHRSRSSSSKDKHSRSDKEKTNSSDKDRHKSDKEKKRVEADKRDQTGSKDSSKQSEAEKLQDDTSQTSEGSRIDDRRGDGQKQIRVNVQTALGDCLAARAQEADDIMLSSNEIKSLAVTIEEELFSMFSDTGHKYRTKYRSLVFNIKDQKNKGLFRKILTGKIKPHKLVQMSTEELASRELAMWREQASKHQLEMIQKTEQQALKESEGAKHVRKKTHKGEVEVEEEDLSILETRLEEKKDPEPEPQEEQPQVPVIDTTDQHRAHLFDLNCKVCTGKIVPGREEKAVKAAPEKPATVTFEPPEEKTEVTTKEDIDDYEKAEKIVKETLRTMQKMEKSVSSLPKMVSSPALEASTPPLSPKLTSSRRESSSSSSASSMSSSSTRRTVVVRSPDSALQSGLETKSKFNPSGPMLWKGFMSMLDVAKFFTSAYRVSGPTDHIVIPDTISILGRISPEHMWDYLSKIRQAGSKDLTVVRFIPGNADEKVAYVHLYSYLNSRGRCGVAASSNKQIKDFYIIPLASHSKIPRTLLPFDGPGLEESRPHMLIGVLVRARGKHATDTSDPGSGGKSGTQSSTASSVKSDSQSTNSSSAKPSIHRTQASSSTKHAAPVVSRDPRLAKLAAREASPMVSAAQSSVYVSSSTSGETNAAPVEEYEPEYVPMPVNAKNAYKPVAEYIPTPTVKKKPVEKDTFVDKKERTPRATDLLDKSSRARKEKYHHHHQTKRTEKKEEIEDDSDPYSPGKEAEPYSPGQEAAADEPYDPADIGLMNESDVPVISSMTVSSSTAPSCAPPAAAAETPSASVPLVSSAVTEPAVAGVTAAAQTDTKVSTRDLVEKMARSNDPQEISAFMVTALSATSSASQQQKLLVELTSRVEERKLQLAEATRPGVGDEDSCKVEAQKQNEGGVSSSSCVGAGHAAQVPPVLPGAAASAGSDTTTHVQGSLLVDAAVEQTVSSSLLLPSSLPAATSTSVTAPQVDTAETEPKPHPEMSLITHCQDDDQSPATINTQTVRDSSADIPDALKALINDVLGNTHVSSLEMRRRMVLKKEVQKVDMSAKEVVKEERGMSEGQLIDMQAEAQKRLMDEAEALKILETVKKLEQASSSAKLEQAGSIVKDGGTATTDGGHEFVPEVVDTKKDTANAAPSVDELLEKLKRGGFQFPVQKADTAGPSSSSSTLGQLAVATRSDNPSSAVPGHSELPATTSATLPSLAPPSVSASASGSSSLSSVSALHLDLRQNSDLPGSAAAAVTSNSGSVDSKATDYRNYNTRVPSTSQNQDDTTLYQDRDDRLYRPSAPSVPKHPLDPFAFPPLPGKSRTYPPATRSNLPLQLGPLHPRFPLPSADPRSTGRAPLPPPGTESKKPPAVLGLVDDLPASDVDFRSRSRAPGSQDRLSPPVQPPSPLPPLPENSRRHNSNQVPGDVDLRSEGSYRPPHTHHTGHHGRGSDRPYQRH